MNLLIKYVIFLLLITFSLAGVSSECPENFFVSDPRNGWINSDGAGLKDVPGLASGTLFLIHGQAQYNNLANVTSFLGAEISRGLLTCLYDADVQLVPSTRYQFRPASRFWINGVCTSRVPATCQFAP